MKLGEARNNPLRRFLTGAALLIAVSIRKEERWYLTWHVER
jgi:hypothetical protein